MSHRTSSTAFHDFLFNMLLIFVVLFVMAFFLIRPPATPPADIDTTDDLVFRLTWNDKSPIDLDMWIKLPTTEIVSFKSKEASIAQLERDDRGWSGDTAIVDGVEKLLLQNLEVARVRQLLDGDYIVSVFFYSNGSGNDMLEEFVMEVIDPNNHKTLIKETGSVVYRGETPVCRIRVEGGKIVDVDTDVTEQLVRQKVTSSENQHQRATQSSQRQTQRQAIRESLEREQRLREQDRRNGTGSYQP